jgi:hypothetical protein
MNDSTPSVTWWLEMVKIARKGFEVLSKGEGQATAWRSRNLARVKKEVLAFSWGTNQTLMVTLKWRIKHIGWFCGSDLIHLELTHIYWMQPSHRLKMPCSRRKSKSTWRHPHLMKIESYGNWFKGNQLKQLNTVYIWSWVNRYVVLSRGMHHIDRYLFIRAQASLCEVWVFCEPKELTYFCWVWQYRTCLVFAQPQ